MSGIKHTSIGNVWTVINISTKKLTYKEVGDFIQKLQSSGTYGEFMECIIDKLDIPNIYNNKIIRKKLKKTFRLKPEKDIKDYEFIIIICSMAWHFSMEADRILQKEHPDWSFGPVNFTMSKLSEDKKLKEGQILRTAELGMELLNSWKDYKSKSDEFKKTTDKVDYFV